jgi:hypothetical protein
MSYNIRIERGRLGRSERIQPRINRLFGGPLRRAKELNVSVKISYRTPIHDANGLTCEIVKRKLENERATLGLFLKAINVANKAAEVNKSYTYYLLDLGKLFPKNLASSTLNRKVNVFLKTKDRKVALKTLMDMNVIYQVAKWEPSFPPSNEI